MTPEKQLACVGWAKAEDCAHHSPRGEMKLPILRQLRPMDNPG